MGVINAVLGNASKLDTGSIAEEIGRLLTPGEKVEHAYKLIRDYFVFTSKRLILVDKQGVSGKKIEFHSIPYSRITRFSVETAGRLDFNSELSIWVVGTPTPFQYAFGKKVSVFEVQTVLATYVLH
jgi:hypothetical protein